MTLMKELHKIIEYKFIDKESKLYDSAIDLRYREFMKHQIGLRKLYLMSLKIKVWELLRI